MREFNYPGVTHEILKLALQARTNEINRAVVEATGNIVQAGPFKDMILPEETSWGYGEISAKLLGTYEQELRGVIEKAISRNPGLVLNIGAAEGYYAVGLARRLRECAVAAFDIDKNSHEVCRAAAKLNGVGDYVVSHGEFHSWMFASYCYDQPAPLVVMDVEGAEFDIIDNLAVESLDKADLIIECHDFKNPSITPMLAQRLAATHDIDLIYEGPRDATVIPMLRSLGTFERAVAVCEWRPAVMNWLACWAKARS